jgi:phage/plasmid-like protein (TIGR03299 family)
MAHQLSITSEGKAEMAFVGETPWHGLGQELSEDATIDTWKVEAGMNWQIESGPVMANAGDRFITFDEKKLLFRGDTFAPLAVVGSKYNIVQPEQVLEFFRDLTEDLGMKLSTAGVLFGGKKFWALADTGMAGKVLGNDEIKGNLLLTSSCDGTSPTVAQFTSVRVVCNNTLSIALADGAKSRVGVRHRSVFSPEDIKKSLGLMHDSWDKFMASVKGLSEASVSDEAAREFYTKLLAANDDEIKEPTRSLERQVEAVMTLMKTGMGSEMSNGTVWGMVNGLTEYFDHHTKARTGDTKLWNSWYGKGADVKDKAFDQALALVA